jgi:hypothetical protein
MNGLPLPEWLLRWLQVDVESLAGGSARLRFARFPEGELGLLAVLALLGGMAFFFLLYTREGSLASWKKASLAFARGLVLAAAALILFYPVLEVDRQRDLRAVTIVLLDDSASFGMRDRYLGAPEMLQETAAALGLSEDEVRSRSRAELTMAALERPSWRFFERLREKNLLELYTFSDALRRPPAPEPREPGNPGAAESPADGSAEPALRFRLEPRGPLTDLASALRGAAEEQGGTRIAAFVVFSDGRLTAGEGVAGVAELLRQRGVPVHSVGAGDPTPLRNVRLNAVLASERVFAGDPVAIDVRLSHEGYGGETVDVELFGEHEPPGQPALPRRLLSTMQVSLAQEQREAAAHFQLALEGLGTHRLVARVAPRPDEALSDDNERGATVEVIEEAARVLLIAGAPSYEYRFLKNLLRRDRRVYLAGWLMSADPDYPQEGNVSLTRLPDDPKELFSYDVVFLLDPDPDGLPPGYAELLQSFAGKHRGGLIYIAGEKYAVKFFRAPAMKPIHDLLPLVPDLARAESESGRGRFHEREWPIVPALAASSHPPTRLSSRPERNRERWQEVAGFYWSLPIRRVKPGATVLLGGADPSRLSESGPQPLLAWQFYEGGRAMFGASDESWRWRATTEEVYDQFWVQTVRFLTETRLAGGRRQLLDSDREVYDLGDIVRISALLQDEAYRPLEADTQPLAIVEPGGSTLELQLEKDPSSPGWFRAVFVPRSLGEHRLRLPDGPERLVRIEPPDLEFQEPRLDEATLRELAERTGGTYRPLWQAGELPGEIPDRRQTVISSDEPIPLWDNWLSLIILAGLLSLEWILRKWNRLA